LDFYSPELQGNKFMLPKPFSLWYSRMKALADFYSQEFHMWQKLLENHVFDKGLVSRIHEVSKFLEFVKHKHCLTFFYLCNSFLNFPITKLIWMWTLYFIHLLWYLAITAFVYRSW
jgi:hypothetical protein